MTGPLRVHPKAHTNEIGTAGNVEFRPSIWEFPKIRGTFCWGPYNKDPTIWGTIFGSPIFGNSYLASAVSEHQALDV